MKKDDILAVAECAASFGFKEGLRAAIECLDSLAEEANSPEARRMAQTMIFGLAEFSRSERATLAKAAPRFKVVFDADGPATIQ